MRPEVRERFRENTEERQRSGKKDEADLSVWNKVEGCGTLSN